MTKWKWQTFSQISILWKYFFFFFKYLCAKICSCKAGCNAIHPLIRWSLKTLTDLMRYIKIIYFCLTIKNILIFHTYICKNCILHVMSLNNMRYVAVPAFIKKKKKAKRFIQVFSIRKDNEVCKIFPSYNKLWMFQFFFRYLNRGIILIA